MREEKPSMTAALIATSYCKVSALYPNITDPVSTKMFKLFTEAFLNDAKNLEGQSPAMVGFLKTDLTPEKYIEKLNTGFLYGVAENSVARKTIIEAEVKRGIERGGVKQVVIAGGGFDTLAIRNSKKYPDVKWIEHDYPATQAVKLGVMNNNKDVFGEIPPNLKFIDHDLEEKGSLINAIKTAGYDNDKKTIFIFEGVFHYLEKDTVVDILKSLQQNSKIGSQIIAGVKSADVINGVAKATAELEKKTVSAMGESYKFSSTEKDMIELSLNNGYITRSISPYHAIQQQFGHSDDVIKKLSEARGTFHVVLENVGRDVALQNSRHTENLGPVPEGMQIAKPLNPERHLTEFELAKVAINHKEKSI